MIDSRFYNVAGAKWEGRFFQKGALFPDTDVKVPRQGIWVRPVECSWEYARFVGNSWRSVRMDADVFYLPERK